MALSSRYSSRPALNATRARQGRYGRHVFWVLVVSTVLAALALFGAWTWRADDLAAAPGFKRDNPGARTVNAPDAPPVRQNEAPATPGG